MTIKVLNRWQVQWSEKLSNFNFEIHYRKESENAKADALSQRSDYMKNKSQMIQSVLSQQWDEIITYNTQTITTTMIIINNELKNTIWAGYLKDKQAQRVLEQLTEGFERISNSLILFKGLVYVPEHQQKDIIQMYHNELLRDHWGVHKMIKAIFWSYYFSHMRKKVQDYENKCNLCHKIKPARHKS